MPDGSQGRESPDTNKNACAVIKTLDETAKRLAASEFKSTAQAEEIGKLVAMFPRIRQAGQIQTAENAALAATYLVRDNGKFFSRDIAAAGRIRRAIGFDLGIYRVSPGLHVLQGLVAFVGVALVLTAAVWKGEIFGVPPSSPTIANDPIWILGLCALAGGAGSVASISSRLHDYAAFAGMERAALKILGGLKPLVGLLFGGFILLIAKAKVLPDALASGDEPSVWLVLSLAFVAGFSERMVRDIATRIEGAAGT